MKILTIAANSLRLLFRERSNFFFVFVLPMVLILVLGLVFGSGFQSRVAVVVPVDDGGKRLAYHLTPKGKDLLTVMTALREWSDRWVFGEGNEPVVFRDRETGAVHMLLQPGQIDREYIYTAAFRDGLVEAGLFRGMFASNKIVSLRRFYDRIEFVAENTSDGAHDDIDIACRVRVRSAVVFKEL